MKKKLLLFSLLAVSGLTYAGNRSTSEMQAIALAHLPHSASVKSVNASVVDAQLLCLKETKTYIVYGQESTDGFVIVAKSDLADPLLGYSTGHFDAADVPPALQWFLDTYSQQIEAAESGAGHSAARAPRRTAATFTPVENFMTTKWSQDYPYNKLTPNNYPSGCVATAIAQCLNYCQWPASASFEGNYALVTTTGTKTTTTWKKENVSTTYTWPYNDTYKSFGTVSDNMPALLRDCGYASYMQYAASGSGALSYLAGVALTNIFNYPQECIKYKELNCFVDVDGWAQIIYDELGKRSPIFYGANDDDYGGHAFVLSGIDDEGLVYVNWGWRGSSNGYYAITNLNPTQGGTEIHFNRAIEMIYGIRPQALPTDLIETTIYGYSGQPYTFRFGTLEDEDGASHATLFCDLPYGFINLNPSDFDGVFGLFGQDLTDGTDWVIAPEFQDRESVPAAYGYCGTSEQYKTFYFYYFIDGEKGLKPGHKYRLSFGTCDDREGKWHSIICVGGELGYDVDYTGDPATSSISEAKTPVPVLTAIPEIRDNGSAAVADDGKTRVYDASGRLVYSTSTASFNLWDVPVRGILVVKQGSQVRKVVR